MKKIIALTDFSDNATQAALYALNLAKKWQSSELVLLHTFEPPVLMTDTPGNSAPDGIPSPVSYSLLIEQADLMHKSGDEQIAVTKRELEAGENDPTVMIKTVVEEGFLNDAANEIAEKESADLVVMGIRGKTGLEKIIIGSNAIRAISGINRPLLIVPDKVTVTFPARVALASDLRLLTAESLQQLHQFLSASGITSLPVINVNMQKEDAANEERVSALKTQLSGLNPVFHFVEAQHIETGIETFVRQNAVSLLIFIHQEKGFFASLFHKSIGKQIAWHTTVPVLRLKN